MSVQRVNRDAKRIGRVGPGERNLRRLRVEAKWSREGSPRLALVAGSIL
jgi:hypothetical protein